MKLLFDHNISPKVARAIHELVKDSGSISVPLRDKFPTDATDEHWIAELGKERGWAVISGDRTISKNKAQRAAWFQTDLIGFFLEPALANLEPLGQTARLILWLPAIEQQLNLITGPAIFALPIRASSRLRQV